MRHWATFVTSWTIDPLVVPVLLIVAVLYALGVADVNRKNPGHRWPVHYSGCFLSGLSLIWLAVLGPFGHYDDVFFWSHMCQHLIITMLAAPLLVLGSPVLLVLRVSSAQQRRRWIVPVLRSSAVRWLTDPIATWVLFVAVVMGTHFSPFYDFSLRHPWVHELVEHPLYLGSALLFYYPLIGTNPAPRSLPEGGRVLSLALMMVPEAITGFFIYASPYVMYPFYAQVSRPFGPDALTDQQLGGALMWSASMLIDTAWVALAARDWLRADARRTRRLDQLAAREARVAQIRFL